MTLQLGIQLPEVERPVPWSEVREIALVAEEVGFDSIWVGDHLLYRDAKGARGPWEAWASLAALAEATERVALGPLVAATAFHQPAMLAKTAATIDEISGGRLIVGLGAGWNRTEFEGFGFPYDHRVSRFIEAFTIIRTLLRDGHIDFAGDWYTVRDCEIQPPPRPGGPPLMLGSNGDRMLRAALPHVDLWNTFYKSYGNTPEGLASLLERIDAACDDVGIDRGAVGRTAAVLVEVPGVDGGEVNPRRDAPPVTGDPESIAEQLMAIAAVGVTHLQLVVNPITPAAVAWLGDVAATVHATHG